MMRGCRVATFLVSQIAAELNPTYPGCMEQNVVLRNAGAHAIFVDVSPYGSTGCWQSDCTNSDKFHSQDPGVCARACLLLEECTHWSYGPQDDRTSCFLRKSDAGWEAADGFFSAPKACAPPDLPNAWLAVNTAYMDALTVCDAGVSPDCPDMARALTTWRFAIAALQRATKGILEPNAYKYVQTVADDTEAFVRQMSHENFPVIVANNRIVFDTLQGWLRQQPQGQASPDDLSLPAPLHGKLCGPSSCFG